MVPGPVPFVPHTDVPAFRGVTRDDHPVWLLGQMMNSGLFEDHRIKLATAVSWFYEGPGGEFHYWPEGPDGDHAVIGTPYENIAVVADNERTYHGVAPVGVDEPLIHGLTYRHLLHRVDGGWEMRDDDVPVHRASDDDVRITVSWKGEIYTDEADRARVETTPTTSTSTGWSMPSSPTCGHAASPSRSPMTPTTTRTGSPPCRRPTASPAPRRLTRRGPPATRRPHHGNGASDLPPGAGSAHQNRMENRPGPGGPG